MTFSGIKQAAEKLKISPSIIEKAKNHPDCDAFAKSGSGRIDADKLVKFINDNLEVLKSEEASFDYWHTLKEKCQALLAEMQVKEQEKKLIEKEYVHSLMFRMAQAQSSLMNSKFGQEFIPRIQGKSEAEQQEIMNSTILEFIGILHRELAKIE